MAAPTPPNRLDYVYREYVRMSELADAYAHSSFDDFKLLGSVGFLVAWPPIATSNLFEDDSSGTVLVIGFIVIAAIVTILAVRDLLKQSIVLFLLSQAGSLEEELGDALGSPRTNAFRVAEHWKRWDRQHNQPILVHLYGLIATLLLVFPNVALALKGDPWNTAVYTPSLLVLIGISYSALRRMPSGLVGAPEPVKPNETVSSRIQ